MAINTLEEYKKSVKDKLEALRPLFAKTILRDFSENPPAPKSDDDEFSELYVGIQTMMEIIRGKIADLEMEVGQRQEVEQRLIARNKEQADMQKALLNVLEDLKKEKEKAEGIISGK